jgi:hypothetical protein
VVNMFLANQGTAKNLLHYYTVLIPPSVSTCGNFDLSVSGTIRTRLVESNTSNGDAVCCSDRTLFHSAAPVFGTVAWNESQIPHDMSLAGTALVVTNRSEIATSAQAWIGLATTETTRRHMSNIPPNMEVSIARCQR